MLFEWPPGPRIAFEICSSLGLGGTDQQACGPVPGNHWRDRDHRESLAHAVDASATSAGTFSDITASWNTGDREPAARPVRRASSRSSNCKRFAWLAKRHALQALRLRAAPCGSSPLSPPGPGWCRCWKSPWHAGCAARALAVSVRIPALPSDIDGASDDAPRHLPNVRLLAGHETEIRPAPGQRNAQRLPFPNCDIGAALSPLAWRRQTVAARPGLTTPIDQPAAAACAQSVSACTGSSAPKKLGCGITIAANPAAALGCKRFKEDRPSLGAVWQLDQFDVLIGHNACARLCCRSDARWSAAGHAAKICAAAPPSAPPPPAPKLHRRDWHCVTSMAGERGHHALVLVQQLQSALACLGLVGRVRRIELAARSDLPDCGRNVMLVGARRR